MMTLFVSVILFSVLITSQLPPVLPFYIPIAEPSSLSRIKRWAYHEIHRCGPIKGYSCMDHELCHKRYGRTDLICYEVYPCLSSCIFIAQLLNPQRLKEQIRRLMYEGIPVNNHPDPVGFVRNMTAQQPENENNVRR
ncbi:hypothetical protein EG68_03099 [Paragonimus skrjabini miyazakii]|uniref:Uncharacterized protein n=1 Tax=Paragonimus skrjabini miyazakii TaxID=59628 RepID=A0A8S9Z3N1_9TREM|nr:hypothetical protein EG68_03099 [Paragonimus skrjabini miyazakii]